LVRWRHPQRGLLAPAVFIPAAEASGFVIEIGSFVLQEACRQIKVWHDTWPGEPMQASVNLSVRELVDPALVSRVARTLRDADLEPRFLTLELTESVLVVDPIYAARQLRALKSLGVMLAVDDFGTGFSSLSHLHGLPFDSLKIDKSFVDTIAIDADGFAFVQGIIRLASTLCLTTVAEGVEDLQQLAHLRRAGCTFMQGYLVARALPPAEVETLIWCDARQEQSAGPRHDDALVLTSVGANAEPQPPAIAPMIWNGSAPVVTRSGSGMSGGSCEMSSSHAK
jgi:EAL domain-containing protein (putative c-di-GMP-specific phosphodiesterase class I)